MDATDAQTACFEAGIKLGSLYHQFAGTPVSPDSAASLATAMEAAIENQPHCESVSVDILPARLDTTHGYDELTGAHMVVEVQVAVESHIVRARMDVEDGYPLMRLVEVRSGTA